MSPSQKDVNPGLKTKGPIVNTNRGNDSKKNKESRTTVYITNVIDLEVCSFSCDKKYNATAEPPKLVGETDDENSHIKINSTAFFQLNSKPESNLSLAEIKKCLAIYINTAIPIQK